MTLSAIATRWDLWNIRTGIREATRTRCYNLVANKFIACVGDIPVSELSESHIEAFRDSILHLKPVSQKSYWRALRVWMGWMVKREYLPTDPTGKIEAPRVPPKVFKLPDAADIGQLDSYVSLRNRVRDKAILALAIDCGLRSSEIWSLTVENVNLKQGLLLVTGKGGKTRIVTPSREAMGQLEEVIYAGEGEGRVFRTEQGEDLSYDGFKNIWRRLKRRSGFRYRFHDLRHYAATDDAMGGMHPFDLMEKMGHSDIQTTMRYVHYANSRLKGKAFQKGPRDHLIK